MTAKGQQKGIVPGTIPLTQEERAKKNGISLMSQRRLDKIARLRPEIIAHIWSLHRMQEVFSVLRTITAVLYPASCWKGFCLPGLDEDSRAPS